jgi:type IV pilus assembly protein PilC
MAKVKLDILVNFTTQFSAMIEAEIPLTKVLDNLQKDTLNKDFSSILKKIKEDVEKGIDFSKAISKYPNVFNTIYINMVRAGMESGKLNVTLNQLGIYLTKSTQTINKIKAALAYPKFMLFAMLIVGGFLLISIIPMFEKMFLNASKELPWLTQAAISSSNFLRDNLFILIGILFILFILIKLFLNTPKGKLFYDFFKLNLPFIGTLNKKSSVSKFIRTFGVLTLADIPILNAIKLSKSSASNIIIENSIEEVILNIEKGDSINDAFRKVGIFPDIILQMINSGEESGKLGELLISSANYYDDQIDNELKSLVSLINPIMTVIMGLFILGIMAAIFMPIFQMGDTL